MPAADLFTDLPHPLEPMYADYRPTDPPSLEGVDELYIDFETTGLKWWDGHRPVGASYFLPDGRSGYLPWAHKGGNNLDEAVVKRWFQREVRDKLITNINTRFEVHMAREWGVDFYEQGCRVSDVAHYAALLDDHRRRFSLKVLTEEYLPASEQKVLAVDGVVLDGSRMAEYPAGMIAVRAIADVRQVHLLKQVMWPLLDKEDLQRVRQLEDDVIYPVCEMEHNASPIDMDKLNAWCADAKQKHHRLLWRIHRDTGLKFNPDKNTDWEKMFKHLGIPIVELTPAGKPSFTDAILKRVKHPIVEMGRRASHLSGLRSKYLDKYQKSATDGRLRYALHQLRSESGGTVTGRFSASALIKGDPSSGINPQQVMAVEKQQEAYGDDYIVRELYIPEEGLYLAADSAQIEYRIFASYANNSEVIAAYAADEHTHFHKLVWEMFKRHKPDLPYKMQKNINFMKIYGGGLTKLALMLEFITEAEAEELRHNFAPKAPPRNHPKLIRAAEIDTIYDKMLPEVGPLVRRASNVARDRGYVRTILGRRCRFPDGNRLYKALNSVIQGGAADIHKRMLVELHRERERIGFTMRLTNHDEVTGDVVDREAARLVEEVLARQLVPLKVPITWDTKLDTCWGKAKPKSKRPDTYADETRGGRS